MTYAELLADNQRLRKRIIELEQENARLKGQYEQLLPESKSPTLESHKSLTEEEKECCRVYFSRLLFAPGTRVISHQIFFIRGHNLTCR